MLNAILTWWLQRMWELCPRWLRPATADGNAVVVAPEPGAGATPVGAAVHLRRNGREQSLGRFALGPSGIGPLRQAIGGAARRTPVLLRLPAGMLLERSVTLPIAAERDPRGVLTYEMDRLTPFRAEEVFWTWSITQRDRAHGRLILQLSLVPRAAVRALAGALAAAGLHATALEIPRPAGAPCRIGLDPTPTRGAALRRGALAGAALGCAILALAALATPFVRQAAARAEMERQIAALRPAVAEAEALRRRIDGAAAGSDVIAAEQARVGDALGVVAAVTAALPDDTYLLDFSLRGGRLELAGRSAAAARLIGVLSADPALRNPAFAAPVTRVEGRSQDQFSIRADIAPPP